MELASGAPAAATSGGGEPVNMPPAPVSSMAAAESAPAAPPRVDELLDGLSLEDSEEEEDDGETA
jgi:hypothetical protein